MSEDIPQTPLGPAPPQFPYVARPLWWFVLLNVASAGLYQVVFFYRGWAYLRDHRGLDVWPLARAIFGPLFAYAYFRRYFDLARERGYPEAPPAGGLAVAYVALHMLAVLPPPAGLGSLVSVLTLLPAAETQNYVWNADAPNTPQILWISWSEVFLMVLGCISWAATIAIIRDPSLFSPPV